MFISIHLPATSSYQNSFKIRPGRFHGIAGNAGNHGNEGKFHESHQILNEI